MTPSVVLVVDDERDSADLLGMVLGLHFPGAAVRVAYGGQAGLDLASGQRPDAAVLDLEMPGMDGEKLAFALRACFSDAPPLLIALSGNVVRLKAIRGNGAFDHELSKPADVDGLVKLLKRNSRRSAHALGLARSATARRRGFAEAAARQREVQRSTGAGTGLA